MSCSTTDSTTLLYNDIARSIHGSESHHVEVIQRLWGGYGELVRLHFPDTQGVNSVIVKHVALPEKTEHPKGWNTQLSHQRKVKSYQVETSWYQEFTQKYDVNCPVPVGLQCQQTEGEWLIVMQDLKTLGFPNTSNFDVLANDVEGYSLEELHQRHACLHWLAHFHAKHIQINPSDVASLWETGTYWHLATRPDELSALADQALKQKAERIDQKLKNCPYPTLVHGDAKLANFCFDVENQNAAAVDFQYVGLGCAMKDVALFMSSAIRPRDCAELESEVLNVYFDLFAHALAIYQPHLAAAEVEAAWRPMFATAWADFQRFVKGWSPNHWKINPYTEQLTKKALSEMNEQEFVDVR
ncbi:aminoglycoside phosphotransferase family protein [Vibrio fortis]|uniref:aminoglycoside phosphotransferase family protein n=1 Tax=Vibrio fortis TaxID=212667 RepID=UPI0021C37813|nr:aminoglycoside phosphotransferase family protein [Vibrio fortis]